MAFRCGSFSELGCDDYGNGRLRLAQRQASLVQVAVRGNLSPCSFALRRSLVLAEEQGEAASAAQGQASGKDKRNQIRLAERLSDIGSPANEGKHEPGLTGARSYRVAHHFCPSTRPPNRARVLYRPILSSRARLRGKICRVIPCRSFHSCRAISCRRVPRLQIRELAIVAESAGLATGMHSSVKPRLQMPIDVWGVPTARKRKKIRES